MEWFYAADVIESFAADEPPQSTQHLICPSCWACRKNDARRLVRVIAYQAWVARDSDSEWVSGDDSDE